MELKDKLIKLRELEDLSQQNLSDLTGLTRATIGALESGKIKTIGADKLSLITNHPRLKKYTMWLMTDENIDGSKPTKKALNENELEELLNRLDDDELEQVLTLAKFFASKPKK